MGVALLTAISLQHLYFEVYIASLKRSLRNLLDLHHLPVGCRVPAKNFEDYQARFYKLLALFNPQQVDECQRHTICDVFDEIVDGVVVKMLPLDRDKMLSSLFEKNDSFLLEKFCYLLWSADCTRLIERSTETTPSLFQSHINDSADDMEGPITFESQDLIQTIESNEMQKAAQSTERARPEILRTTLVALTTADRTIAWRQKYWLCLQHHRHLVEYILVSCLGLRVVVLIVKGCPIVMFGYAKN